MLDASQYLEKWRRTRQKISLTYTGNRAVVDRLFCAGKISELTTDGFVLSWGQNESARFRVSVKVELSEDKETLRYLFNFGDVLTVSAIPGDCNE